MFRNNHFTHDRHVLSLLVLMLSLCLGAVPAFATEPEEADPDPDELIVLMLTDRADLDVSRLAPGRYIVRIVDEDGATREVHEIVVRRK